MSKKKESRFRWGVYIEEEVVTAFRDYVARNRLGVGYGVELALLEYMANHPTECVTVNVNYVDRKAGGELVG